MSHTVFVGLSGGVDSAVSAMLLKERGFNVVGVFIKIWQPQFLECTWASDRLDAMRVCVALGIPFREIDLSQDYKRTVVDEMVAGYKSGITPNPDVLCNRTIKFGCFFDYAMKQGADYIATGHYARITEDSGGRFLARGKDENKDQSYFLYALNESQLQKTIFPVGELLKTEVRKLAKKEALPVAEKHDSQGLCFVGDVSLRDFLSRYIQLRAGLVLDMRGNVVGRHDGAPLYTIGQRHGFSVFNTSESKPVHFVCSTDVTADTISVSSDINDCKSKGVRLQNIHWISSAQNIPLQCKIQTRYREPEIGATVFDNGTDGASANFEKTHIASPGQSMVFYQNERCLGGAVIKSLVNQ